MRDGKKIMDLIKRGEDESLDFKKNINNPVKIARTMVSFANTNGGDIVVGVDDFGEIHKIDIQQEKYVLIKAAKNHCVPPIYLYFDTLKDKEDEILVVHVRKSNEEHCVLDEKGDMLPYIRVKDQSIIAPHARSSGKSKGAIPIFGEMADKFLIQYLRERPFITVSEYMKMMKISYPVAKKSLDHLVETGVIKVSTINKEVKYSLQD